MPQSPHFGAVPRFLMWRTRRSPPGVLITRVRLEVVLYLRRRLGLAGARGASQNIWEKMEDGVGKLTGCGDGMLLVWVPLLRFVVRIAMFNLRHTEQVQKLEF